MLILALLSLVQSIPIHYIVGGDVPFEPTKSENYTISYSANYKPITLEFTNSSNIKHYIISDKELSPEHKRCPEDSLYCSFADSLTVKEQISVCIEMVYLHLFPIDNTKIITARIKTDYLKDIPCNDINRNPTNFCQLLPPEECLKGCATGCGLVKCQQKKSLSNIDVFSLCMPDTTPSSELDRRCSMHKDVNKTKWETCGTTEDGGNWLVWVVIIVLLLLLIFGGVVIYYQKMYQKHGRPPFRVPRFFPKKLFPRVNDEEIENLRVIQ